MVRLASYNREEIELKTCLQQITQLELAFLTKCNPLLCKASPQKVLTTESAYLVQSGLSYKDSVVKVYQAYYYKSQ